MQREQKPEPKDMNMSVAYASLADCAGEIVTYLEKMEDVTCPELKGTLEKVCRDEKEHVAEMLTYLCKRDPQLTKELYSRLYSHYASAQPQPHPQGNPGRR